MRNIALCGLLAVLLLGVIWSAGCSSSSGKAANIVQITPSSATVTPGGSQFFSADRPVFWSVQEPSGGSIDQSGNYTAPATLGLFHVIATCQADANQRAVISVVVSDTGGMVPALQAAPLADAVAQSFPAGGNLVRWPLLGDRVIAYLIYRNSNPNAPIAVLPGSTNFFVDSATPLPGIGMMMETIAWDIAIDPNTARVQRFDDATTYEPSTLNMGVANLNLANATFHILSHRVPLRAGDACGYRIQVLYEDYEQPGLGDPVQHPGQYFLYLGQKSDATAQVTLTEPPDLQSPSLNQYPTDGLYTCSQVRDAFSYVLQISPQPTFPANNTLEKSAIPSGIANVVGVVSQSELYSQFNGGQLLYWRMGARVDGGPTPMPMNGDTSQQGWVYSANRYFTLPQTPPPPPGG